MGDKKVVVVVGGTGFVGQGILAALSAENFELHSFSRHQFNSQDPENHIVYHAVNLNHPGEWQDILKKADWVIDAVGILFPNPFKNVNYKNSSVEPAQKLLNVLTTADKTKFLFVSANATPFFLNAYLKAKLTVENTAKTLLGERAYNVFPGIVYDKSRMYSYIPAIILKFVQSIPGLRFLKRYRPVSREYFSKEVTHIILGHLSELSQRKY
ncbi:NADH dehydrogenase [Leuconostoc litchii]|uniref:NAD-dependent epimerase/dehydratase family protein n=1 Tax=Leuconostoc litchii TaxID=1981069 RepID=A0A6P2CKX6_9LACO|nr:NAD-dependent epimerase/dehydratase family protein [Leuconostoc litchii]TYC46640.1 NAD-dependent epimerase/dehydratase family protein [Leuconostoc litchii]GMA70506.1 NADH dehydrogenase [Leuconostoc litchii]